MASSPETSARPASPSTSRTRARPETPRDATAMEFEKEVSIRALRAADVVPMRPHLLLCAVCQYAGGTRPPFKADNLPEFLQMVLTDRPEVPVRLVRQADWLMCACCPQRVARLNACVNILGSGGMSNEKRDLDLLQKLAETFLQHVHESWF